MDKYLRVAQSFWLHEQYRRLGYCACLGLVILAGACLVLAACVGLGMYQ